MPNSGFWLQDFPQYTTDLSSHELQALFPAPLRFGISDLRIRPVQDSIHHNGYGWIQMTKTNAVFTCAIPAISTFEQSLFFHFFKQHVGHSATSLCPIFQDLDTQKDAVLNIIIRFF